MKVYQYCCEGNPEYLLPPGVQALCRCGKPATLAFEMNSEMSKSRLDEIRARFKAFKHWYTANPVVQSTPYEETTGPDMEFLLAEIDRLREALRLSHAVVSFVRKMGHHEKSGTELGKIVAAYLEARKALPVNTSEGEKE